MHAVDPQFEALLIYLKEARGFDFTGYKRSSLMRRVSRRMVQLPVSDYTEYLDYLQVHQDEFTALFNTILINVTGFFRDPDAWDYLRKEILEPMIAAKPPGATIRLWSAGCASGEEAYTLAILLAEILGPEEFRQRVKIYATDVDDVQLNEARHATYSARAVSAVPDEFRERYFEPVVDGFAFRGDLRRSVIFGRNDLVQDAPISRIDLLSCRNTLMYFNAETQARILGRFHFALIDGGALFLGKAEMLLSHGSIFMPSDLKRRVFRKVPRPLAVPIAAAGDRPPIAGRDPLSGLDLLRNEVFLTSPVAQLVVTSDGLVALLNQQAEAMFGVSSRDVGRPFRDLDVSYRPVELRKYIDQAQVERRPLHLTDVEHRQRSGETTYLSVQINPLVGTDASLLGVAVVFQDVTAARQLREDLERANRDLEAAYEELQSTNEELETTNEELQSTVEELETTNEELQSTNEELETTNEELQSTNDELQSMNDQLNASSSELDDANSFLDAVLTGLRSGVAVVDRDLRVRAWNRRAENLWGLRTGEVVGEHLLTLDIGLPIESVRPLLRQALSGDADIAEVQLAAVNRRGRHITVRVTCSPLVGQGPEVTGAIIVMDSDESPPPATDLSVG